MTLTITEAMDAIRALDTDPDIILGACRRLTTETAGDTETITANEVATRLCGEYMFKKPTSEVIHGIIVTLVSLASAAAKPSHEVELLDGLLQSISSMYGKALLEICKRQMHADPEGGIRRLMGIMEGIAKTESDNLQK